MQFRKNILVLDIDKPQSEGWVLLKDDVKDFRFKELPWFVDAETNNKAGKEIEALLIYTNNEKQKNNLSKKHYFKDSSILKTASLVKIRSIKKITEDEWTITLECTQKVGLTKLFDKDQIVTNVAEAITSASYNNFEEFSIEDENDFRRMAENISMFDETLSKVVPTQIYPKLLQQLLIRNNNGLDLNDWINEVGKTVSLFSDKVDFNLKQDGSVNAQGIDDTIILTVFAIQLVLNNYQRYVLLAKRDFIEQVDYLINLLAELPTVGEFSKEELDILARAPFFKKIIKHMDNSTAVKKANNADKKDKNKDKEQVEEWKIEQEIQNKVRENLDKQQKEFLLREKMKAIKETLNESDPNADDDEFQKVLNDPVKSKMYPSSVLKLINTEKDRLKGMMQGTPDANITQVFVNTLKSLPWRKVEIETLDIQKARDILDKNHYGLKEVKQRIIEYLALIINHKNIAKAKKEKSELLPLDKEHQIDLDLFKEDQNTKKIQKTFNNVPILTLVGPPGTGKTSLARAIAEALNKSYIKISLGGVHDESEIRGHRRTYVGAMPGKIIKAIQRAGVSNPLILLDEIDKMSADHRGDPSSAMLEVLDPEQNTKFQDNYLEHEYDLSKVMFIATANYYENIPPALLDRVEIIELSSYTINEKIKIAREHLINAVVQQAGLNKDQFIIDNDVIEYIIKHYTIEAGVRGLKRLFDKIARKIVTKIVSGEQIKEFVITKEIATDFLGVPKFVDDENEQKPAVGVVNGLAYTSVGGTTLQIEVTTFKGKGGLKLTGSLKDVMKESANIALTYVRSNAEKFGIKDFDFDENEIHIHVPEGAVPKDGPSAGVTFTTALISALSNKPVPQTVAMTGEITLRGRVLEIGGLKEKSFAAYKKGVKHVFIPFNNKKNLVDIPEEVREALEFIPVKSYDEIYDVLFNAK
nr:endopeptidase La [Mycoplasmopsis iners]